MPETVDRYVEFWFGVGVRDGSLTTENFSGRKTSAALVREWAVKVMSDKPKLTGVYILKATSLLERSADPLSATSLKEFCPEMPLQPTEQEDTNTRPLSKGTVSPLPFNADSLNGTESSFFESPHPDNQ